MSLSEYSLRGKEFLTQVVYEKSTLYVVKFRAKKTSYMVFQHKSLLNLVKDLFKWNEGLRRSVTVRVQSEGQRIFDQVVYEKSTLYVVKFRAQKLAIWCSNINRFWT